MGSKNRIAKEILPIILKDRKPDQWYVEPFCGGCNIIDKVEGNRMANDVNKYLIAFLESLSQGWLPPENITEEEYLKIKNNIDSYEEKIVGYVGFQLSFGAMWFSSYRKDSQGIRNYSREAFNNVKKQSSKLRGIRFYNKNYWELEIPDNSIIYCDPPYEGTIQYKENKKQFNYNQYWNWIREMSKKGHQIFCSEYDAPKDFECIWEKEIKNNISNKKKYEIRIEKLFVYNKKL